MTLREWLERGTEQLRASPHPEKARQDAETLLLHWIGKTRAWLLTHQDEDFAGCRAVGFWGLIERRERGEPIQYITGETEFYGLALRVTPDVLIPRPETEHLVEKAQELAGAFASLRIVDVGTGSGAIAIALAHKLTEARVTAIDVSEKSLEIARENAERIGVAGRIRFECGDLLEELVIAERFEMVVSNPPYVPERDRAGLAVEVREHEPGLALFAGEDGLDVYRRLIPQAHGVLAPGGLLMMEIGQGQAEAVEALMLGARFRDVRFTPDLQGIPRVAVGRRE
jgi:release factor glutamine methyltransferase